MYFFVANWYIKGKFSVKTKACNCFICRLLTIFRRAVRGEGGISIEHLIPFLTFLETLKI